MSESDPAKVPEPGNSDRERHERVTFEYTLVCIECGSPIRISRTIASDVGQLPFYVDEQGYEHRDFHWHVVATPSNDEDLSDPW